MGLHRISSTRGIEAWYRSLALQSTQAQRKSYRTGERTNRALTGHDLEIWRASQNPLGRLLNIFGRAALGNLAPHQAFRYYFNPAKFRDDHVHHAHAGERQAAPLHDF